MRRHDPLDNPFWNALTSRQSSSGFGNDLSKRYWPEIAPFASVASATMEAEKELISIARMGDHIRLLGIAPAFSSAWEVMRDTFILQMVCENPIAIPNDADIRLMSSEDVPAMLALTSMVYPAYFRQGTAELGAYFGIFRGDQLCAMAGERVSMTGYQEISAVCTHPDYTGRGYAFRLLQHLVGVIAEKGDVPFLHVDGDNERAIALYKRSGFELRREIPFWLVKRL